MRGLAALACLALLATGCTGPGEERRTLTVLAASSLTVPFRELAKDFEASHAGVDVHLVLGSSGALVDRVDHGARADVLAVADEATIERAMRDGATSGSPPREFASNELQLAVPAANPGEVDAIDDLDRPDVDWVVCVPTAPCGSAARRAVRAAGITTAPAREAADVRAVLRLVEAGKADAGFVYRSDVETAGDRVDFIELPRGAVQTNTYWMVGTPDPREPQLAQEWISLVLGKGQSVLADAGFGPADLR